MTAQTSCTYYSDYTWDPSRCWSLGSVSITTHSHTAFLRDLSFSLGTGRSDIIHLIPATNTDFDHCLPGPKACSYVYTAADCPPGHLAISSMWHNWAICCPSALPLNNYSTDLAVLRTYSDAITESFYTEVVPICEYAWITKDHSISTYKAVPLDSTFEVAGDFTLLIRAVIAIYSSDLRTSSLSGTLSPSASPSATPSVPSSTSPVLNDSPTVAPTGNSRLSQGSRIGIGLGVAIGGLVLVLTFGTIYFLLRRRKRSREEAANDNDMGATDKAELPDNPLPKHQVANEKYSEPVYEMAGSSAPAKLGEEDAEKIEQIEEKTGVVGEVVESAREDGNVTRTREVDEINKPATGASACTRGS